MKKLKIWLIKAAENAGLVGGRNGRTASLANYLAEQGHDVTWWTSTWLHWEKRYLHNGYEEKKCENGLLVVMLHSAIVYKKNMSISRLLYSKELARQLRKHMELKEAPDIILCSLPIPEMCYAAVAYGKKHGTPVIIDCRDQWPDIYENMFPEVIKPVVRIAMKPMKWRVSAMMKDADAVFAMSQPMLRWGLSYAKRKKTVYDRVFFITTEYERVSDEKMEILLDEWRRMGVTDKTWNLCMFSTLRKTQNFDISTLIKSVRKIHEIYPDIRLIIGGTGDGRDEIERLAGKSSYVVLPGYLDKEQMTSLMTISKCGIYPIIDGWGNQVGQFFSGGLPLVTCSVGVAEAYIKKYDCGIHYDFGNEKMLTESLISLIENPKRQRELSEHALSRYKEDFESDRVNNRFEEAIADVILKYKNATSK